MLSAATSHTPHSCKVARLIVLCVHHRDVVAVLCHTYCRSMFLGWTCWVTDSRLFLARWCTMPHVKRDQPDYPEVFRGLTDVWGSVTSTITWLNPSWFLFCGATLRNDFCNKPHKINALKMYITNEIIQIDSTILRYITSKL